MKKCCFIIPYFGTFNNYFPLFLKSCAYNPDFNWLIITDDHTNFNYPNNVKVIYWSFNEFINHANIKFNTKCNIIHPYKLCDLKPMYGYLFEEYIHDFLFWGHCDVDIILGNLNSFITNELLNHYDKLFCLGHMILYKNTFANNRIFMNKLNGEFYYMKVLKNEKILVFDEEGENKNNINQIFLKEKKKVYQEDLSLNFNIRYSKFIRTIYVAKSNRNNNKRNFVNEKFVKAVYLWDKGHIYRLYKHNKELVKESFMYMHLQQRKMFLDPAVLNTNVYKIVANRFLPIEEYPITYRNFHKIKKRYFCNQYYSMCIKPNLKISRLLKKLGLQTVFL